MTTNRSPINLLKGTALLLIAFYGIATGRSLLPGVCSTLAALDAGQASSVEAQDCCAHIQSGEPVITAQPISYAACALCNLSESVANPSLYSHVVAVELQAEAKNSLEARHPELPHVWTPAALRAPPVTA